MIAYSDNEATAFTKEIVSKQGFGTLQAWLLDPNPYKHAQLLLDYIRMDKEPPYMIYDVGCGTGEMLFQAGERFPRSLLYGVNRFGSQVSKGLEKYGVELREADFEHFSLFDNRQFDLIMCNYTLGHFEKPDGAIAAMAGRLRPKGKLLIYDICQRSVLWDNIYGYHLLSQRTLRSSLSLFRHAELWVPNNAMLSPVLDEGVRHDFLTKTIPVIAIGER